MQARAQSELEVANERKAIGRKRKALVGGGIALAALPVLGTKVTATALLVGGGAVAQHSRRTDTDGEVDSGNHAATPADHLFSWMWADAGHRGGNLFIATARANPLRVRALPD
jgi:hypothetical protein